jgi:hypothetical protein
MRATQLVTIAPRASAWLTAALLGVGLAACRDSTEPGPDTLRAAVHGTQPPMNDTTYVPTPLRFASWAPPLETYDTTFTLVQGVGSADTIYFQKRPGAATREIFMVLAIPPTAGFVDPSGRTLEPGSEVRLAVQVDRDVVRLNFGPHGSKFTRKPARLYIWWQNTDLQGRSGNGLQLWYRPGSGTAWTALEKQVSPAFTWLVADLYHFSNYAVAY